MSRPRQTSLGRLVARFLAEMHRYDGGRTLPVLHQSGLTTPQLAVLDLVRIPCTASAVAAHLGLSRPATSQLVQKLVERGLLIRSEGKSDRRERALVLSQAGETLLGEIASARAARFEAALAVLPAGVAARLKSGLSAAVEALQDAPALGSPRPAAQRKSR